MTPDLEASFAALGYAKVLIALKPDAAPPAAAEAALAAHFVVPSEAQAARLSAVADRAASRSFRRPQALTKRKMRIYPHLGLAIGYVDREGATALAADAQVEKIVPAPELSLIRPVRAGAAAKSKVEPTWGIKRLRVPELWAAGLTGVGVLVGHLDTGVDDQHPALKDAIDEFAEFDLAGDRVPGAKPWDSDTITPAHGTHTAGTIAGRPTSTRVVGVAPGAKLASGMVIEGGQVIDRILSGMDWAVSKGVRILNMSLGLRGFTPAFQVLTDSLRAHNVLPVFAVGNEGPETSRSPGNYVNVVSVGAMNEQDIVADFSGSQTFNRPGDPLVPDLVAPGVGVISCGPAKGYAALDGSSMATPHVAGLAALLLQAKPSASADDLVDVLNASCKLPNQMLQERGNRGVPDAVEAFTRLMGHPPAAAIAAAAPVRRGSAPRRTARGARKDAAPRPGKRRVERAERGARKRSDKGTRRRAG